LGAAKVNAMSDMLLDFMAAIDLINNCGFRRQDVTLSAILVFQVFEGKKGFRKLFLIWNLKMLVSTAKWLCLKK
jgi:hypothetical protein